MKWLWSGEIAPNFSICGMGGLPLYGGLGTNSDNSGENDLCPLIIPKGFEKLQLSFINLHEFGVKVNLN